jgi:hypothetical protein
VQGDRATLEQARDELAAARQKLAGAVDAADRRALEATIVALQARLAAPPNDARTSAGDDLDARLERALRAQDERVRAIVAEELVRARAGATSTTTSAAPAATLSPAAAQARQLVADARARLAAQHIEFVDVEGAQALADAVESALGRGDGEAALGSARELTARAAAVVVDRPFVRRKFERVRALLGRNAVPAATKARAEARFKEATALSDRNPEAANVALHEALLLLR